MALNKINGNFIYEQSVALLQGQYLDAYFENELETFKEQHPEMFKKDGTLLAIYKNIDDIITFY